MVRNSYGCLLHLVIMAQDVLTPRKDQHQVHTGHVYLNIIMIWQNNNRKILDFTMLFTIGNLYNVCTQKWTFVTNQNRIFVVLTNKNTVFLPTLFFLSTKHFFGIKIFPMNYGNSSTCLSVATIKIILPSVNFTLKRNILRKPL